MRLFRHSAALPAPFRGAVLALGNFDGVHRGHRAVIGAAAAEAVRCGTRFGVVTFEPHPRQVFDPGCPPFRLTPFRVKMHELEALGCDLAVCLHFDRKFAGHSAEYFAGEILHRGLGVSHVVVGYDFVFGRGRAGDAGVLRRLGAELGFGTTVVAPSGEADAVFSSTEIRERLQRGDARGAAALLGRPWEIDGRVEPGDRIGRTLGFPTANLGLGEYLRPAEGVYAVRAGIERGDRIDWHDAVANLGKRPTIGGKELRFEVHLLDFAGDLYGRHLRVQLIDWIRPDATFAGLPELTLQIGRDVESARILLKDRIAG